MQTRTSGAREDQVTGAIEAQTSKIPSSGYLAAAVGTMAASALFKAFGKNHAALFVGQWAPALLIMGIYNKMVKQHGSDVESRLDRQLEDESSETFPNTRAASASA